MVTLAIIDESHKTNVGLKINLKFHTEDSTQNDTI
jgi:hypothetical protein